MDELPLSTPTVPSINSKRQLSRDEMNLAEFPLTVLSTRMNSDVKTLEFSDSIHGKNGELLNRTWTITGADKFGLPTASDDEVLLGLMKLTSEQGFKDRKIFFTRYELLRTLRWTTEGRSYSRLQKALDRLSGVRIKTTNGFFDNETKAHSTRNFGIIDAYEINDGRAPGAGPRPSFFTWSETIFKSFQVGFIKKLDLDFLLQLKSAVSKRLYRYLDKHFWYRSKVPMNLFTLAHEKLGISRNYAYASQLKQQLDPAVEELIEKGFLSGAEYRGKGSETEIIFLAAAAPKRGGEIAHEKLENEQKRAAVSKSKLSALDLSPDLTGQITELLVQRGIRAPQVEKLLAGHSEKVLHRMLRIIEHFDELVSAGSASISRSPIGFLYRAIENPEHFILPGEGPGRVKQYTLGMQVDSATKRTTASTQKLGSKPQVLLDPQLEAEFLVERKKEIEKLKTGIEPEMLARMRQEVSTAWSKVKGTLSSAGFALAVEQGVEEKLAKMFDLPDFTEWKRAKQKTLKRAV